MGPLPTLPGKVAGIVGDDPPTLQCQECYTTVSGPRFAPLVILSGFHFHICEGRGGIRRCPPCLASAKAQCSASRCEGA